MTDDRDRQRRARTHQGDAERIAAGRAYRTPGMGIPVELDEETTPPPQPPPDIEQLSLPDQVRALKETLQRHAEGLERVWDARNDGDRLGLLERGVHGIDKQLALLVSGMEEFLKPAVKSMMMRVDSVEQWTKSIATQLETFFDREWPGALKQLESLEVRVKRTEGDVEKHDRAIERDGQRLEECRGTDNKQEVRIRSLEDDRLASKTQARTIRASAAAVAALISLVVALIGVAAAIHFGR